MKKQDVPKNDWKKAFGISSTPTAKDKFKLIISCLPAIILIGLAIWGIVYGVGVLRQDPVIKSLNSHISEYTAFKGGRTLLSLGKSPILKAK